MLRIIQNTAPAGAKTYFSTADYYSEGCEVMGVWRGKAAERLGLAGEIQQRDWDALCDNTDPATGRTLTARQNEGRRVGYDFNFHAPKSLSLLYALTQDERLLDAFTASVNDTMTDMEAEMKARVRVDGQNSDRVTGNMAWGEYVHFTSRPVAGVPDPHLHAHCFVFNATFDAAEPSTRRGTGADAAAEGPENVAGQGGPGKGGPGKGGQGQGVQGEGGRWKAGQFGDLKRDAPYFEAMFHSRLARRLEDLGLATQRTRTGWELAGIDPATLRAFSRRTAQIEQEARAKGITDITQKSELGAKTREKKVKGLTFATLQAQWAERMTDDERIALDAVKERIGAHPTTEHENAARDAVTFAIDHGFTRSSTLPDRTLAASALKQGVGKASAAAVLRELEGRNLIKAEREGRTIVTTRAVLAEETRMLDFARHGRGAFERLGRDSADQYTFTREYLSDDQKHAVLHVLRSRDRVTVVRGAAGVGKTTMMKEAVEAIEQQGTQVFVFAPSTQAARGVLRDEEHFEHADTVARLLVDTKLQSQTHGQLIWIDEAGLLSSKDMAAVFELAKRENARVILSGDKHQHASVERGSPLRLLETEAGLVPAEIREIQRQKGRYKALVHDLSEGRVGAAFQELDRIGWIHEVREEERYDILAREYVHATSTGQTALVVSPTHREGDMITASIRTRLRDQGKLGQGERLISTLTSASLTEAQRRDPLSYLPTDTLVFHQNAKGFTKGQRVSVSELTGAKHTQQARATNAATTQQATKGDIVNTAGLPLDQAARFDVFRPGEAAFSPGDLIRITRNGQTLDKQHALNNGAVYTLKDFSPEGHLVLTNGWTVAKDFGHLAHGYVVTSHASQGRSVDRVLIGQSSRSFPASSREQFYVSVSRGKRQATIYTDDKVSLLDAVLHSGERLTATELQRHKEREHGLTLIRNQTFEAERARAREEAIMQERLARDRSSSDRAAHQHEANARAAAHRNRERDRDFGREDAVA